MVLLLKQPLLNITIRHMREPTYEWESVSFHFPGRWYLAGQNCVSKNAKATEATMILYKASS